MVSARDKEPTGLAAFTDALALCTYCPSLCRHMCPVATASGRESASPWALMSLVEFVRTGQVELTPSVAAELMSCVGCGACTHYCDHHNDVSGALRVARSVAASRGLLPVTAAELTNEPLSRDAPAFRQVRAARAYEATPAVALIPGHHTMSEAPETVTHALSICEDLDVEGLSCGDAARLDAGFELWHAGFEAEFIQQAKRFLAAIRGAREVVCMSPQTAYLLKSVYPAMGLNLNAPVMHISEFLLPVLTGAIIRRLDVDAAYHDSCHLARGVGAGDVPVEVLRRILKRPPRRLRYSSLETWCCGGTGCLSAVSPEVTEAMGREVIEQALATGASTLVSFSPECVVQLRAVAAGDIAVEHAVTLVARAVVSDEVNE